MTRNYLWSLPSPWPRDLPGAGGQPRPEGVAVVAGHRGRRHPHLPRRPPCRRLAHPRAAQLLADRGRPVPRRLTSGASAVGPTAVLNLCEAGRPIRGGGSPLGADPDAEPAPSLDWLRRVGGVHRWAAAGGPDGLRPLPQRRQPKRHGRGGLPDGPPRLGPRQGAGVRPRPAGGPSAPTRRSCVCCGSGRGRRSERHGVVEMGQSRRPMSRTRRTPRRCTPFCDGRTGAAELPSPYPRCSAQVPAFVRRFGSADEIDGAARYHGGCEY